MSAIPLAITSHQAGNFAANLLVVYTVLILLEILVAWIPRRPYYRALEAVIAFIHQTTDPYLRIFRSFIKPIGAGQFALDVSPIVALLVLGLVGGVIVQAIYNL